MARNTDDTTNKGAETINSQDDNEANHKQKVIPEPDRPVVNTAAVTGEPDFDALAVTSNEFSDTTVAPPPLEGTDDAPTASRGRPALTPEARAERKKARDKEYRDKKAGGKVASKQVAAGATSETSSATAEMVVATLDLVLITASDGEFAQQANVRTVYVTAWSKYIEQSGRELPAWAEVALMSAVYILPALRSPTIKERVGFAFLRAKSFFKRG